MRRVKLAILALILLVGGIAFASFWGNLREKKARESVEEVPKIVQDGSDNRLEKIRFVEDKHGQKTWELEATSVQQYQGEEMLVLQDVKVTFYSKDGKVYTLSGKNGRVEQKTRNMQIKGDVVLTSSDGYSLKTQSLDYRHEERKASTSDPVEIEGEKIRVTGNGMLVDLDAKTYRILHQVKTHLKGREKG
jgi:LPS export ABC transporter protein LptC